MDTEAKNNAKKAAGKFIRPFVAQFLKFDPITNEDRRAMNLHNRDTTKKLLLAHQRPARLFQTLSP
ncbi:MAG: hypothetical protein LBG24_07400 [Treponema sp.]|nr:hypothetical protein [Treponema sp.]